MSTGLPTLAAAGRKDRSCRFRLPLTSSDTTEPVRLAGIGRKDAGSAGVGENGDAAAARQRLSRQQRGDVEQLRDRVGADHAGLVKQRVDEVIRRGERAGVRCRRARAGG